MKNKLSILALSTAGTGTDSSTNKQSTNTMKSKKLASSLILFASAATSHAAISVQDSFLTGGGSNYTVGNIEGQNPTTLGFSGAWVNNFGATGNKTISATNLSPSVNAGGSVNFVHDGRIGRSLTSAISTTGTIYIGFTFQASAANYQALEFTSGGTGDSNRTIQVGASGSDFGGANFGLRINNSNTLQLQSNTAFNTNINTYVLRLNLSATSNGDSITMFVNPANESSGSTTLTGFDFNGIDRFGIANFSSAGLSIGVDEIRFADNFAEAIPEPSSSALLLGGLGSLALIRRRRS